MKRKSKIKTKKSAADMAFDSVNLIFLGLFAIACIYPFYYILINSVSNNKLVELGVIVPPKSQEELMAEMQKSMLEMSGRA